jgi:hypothetical protein
MGAAIMKRYRWFPNITDLILNGKPHSILGNTNPNTYIRRTGDLVLAAAALNSPIVRELLRDH